MFLHYNNEDEIGGDLEGNQLNCHDNSDAMDKLYFLSNNNNNNKYK